MNKISSITIPEASYYTLGTFGNQTNSTYTTTASTSLYITDNTNTLSEIYGTNLNKYIKRNRTPKKKKGSIVNANDKRLRIKNLIKPIVAFKFLKNNFNKFEREILNERLERISQLLEATSITNQIALKDKIEEKFGKLLREQEMFACGFNKFFEKSILQAFVDSVKDKAIKITPIKNYIRLIPKDIRERMELANEKKLFDNYVVIHCDPENNAIEKTLEEKKDPILCGIIKQSSRYYFIGDWQDELCDLTMDTILDHLGLNEEDIMLPKDVEVSLFEALYGESEKENK